MSKGKARRALRERSGTSVRAASKRIGKRVYGAGFAALHTRTELTTVEHRGKPVLVEPPIGGKKAPATKLALILGHQKQVARREPPLMQATSASVLNLRPSEAKALRTLAEAYLKF